MGNSRAEKYFRRFLAILFVTSIAFSFFYRDWIYIFVSFVMLVLLVYPSKIEEKFGVSFSSWLSLAILLFTYACLFLGEMNKFYIKFWWWDIMLHSFSAVIIGLLGFSVVYFLNSEAEHSNLSPLFVAIFGFSFSIMIGVLWEIFEFLADYFLGFNMQKSGVVDTMTDLIVNGLGALVVSCWGYLSLKGNFKETFDFFRSIIIKG
jgi:hypothetical protein